MPRTRRIRMGDQEFDAVEVGFEPVRETWSEYELTDGGRLRMRVIVRQIFQILDASGQPLRRSDGDRVVYAEADTQSVFNE